MSAPHRPQSLSFIHALPVHLKELVRGMSASYSVVFFSILFVFYKGTALLEADGAREKSPVRALATVFHITHTSVLLRRLTVLP